MMKQLYSIVEMGCPPQVTAVPVKLGDMRGIDPGAKAAVFSAWGHLLTLISSALTPTASRMSAWWAITKQMKRILEGFTSLAVLSQVTALLVGVGRRAHPGAKAVVFSAWSRLLKLQKRRPDCRQPHACQFGWRPARQAFSAFLDR